MILGYATSGFACHRLEDAIGILARIGYRSVAITLDVHHLNPLADDWPAGAAEVKRLLSQHSMRCTVDTGARFLLDPHRRDQPTLISAQAAERDQRIEYLCRSIDVAVDLEADSVSLRSGAPDEDAGESAGGLFDRLCAGIRDVLAHAERHRMPLALEPCPGMLIDTVEQFERLHQAVDHPLLGLTLNVGHVHRLGEGDLYGHLQRWYNVLLNVRLQDARRRGSEQVLLGQGEVNFTEVIDLLTAVGYRGPAHVVLSHHSHDAPNAAARAYEFLSALWPAQDDQSRSTIRRK